MKKILFSLIFLPLLILCSCDKEGPGDNYNFDNVVAPYVAFNSTAGVGAVQGTSLSVPIIVRTAIQEDLNITIAISGAFVREQSIVLPKGTTSVNASIAIPTGIIVAPATSATATLAITRAISASGIEFSIGRLANPDTQRKSITITLP